MELCGDPFSMRIFRFFFLFVREKYVNTTRTFLFSNMKDASKLVGQNTSRKAVGSHGSRFVPLLKLKTCFRSSVPKFYVIFDLSHPGSIKT